MFTSGASCPRNSVGRFSASQSSRIVLCCSRTYVISTPQQQRSDLIRELGPRLLDQSLPYIKLHPDPALLIASAGAPALFSPELWLAPDTARPACLS